MMHFYCYHHQFSSAYKCVCVLRDVAPQLSITVNGDAEAARIAYSGHGSSIVLLIKTQMFHMETQQKWLLIAQNVYKNTLICVANGSPIIFSKWLVVRETSLEYSANCKIIQFICVRALKRQTITFAIAFAATERKCRTFFRLHCLRSFCVRS